MARASAAMGPAGKTRADEGEHLACGHSPVSSLAMTKVCPQTYRPSFTLIDIVAPSPAK